VEWIADAVPPENPSAEFALQADGLALGNGRYFVGSGDSEKQVEGAEFERHLSSVNWDRRWNYAAMKRGEKVCKVRRKRTTPACGEIVTNLAPWQMQFLNGELRRWEQAEIPKEKRAEMLLAFLAPLRSAVVAEFASATGLEIPASYLHFDSNKVHAGVIYSHINKDNQLVGVKYLRTIGPWSVAVSRATELGAADPADGRLRDNLERFAKRHGADTEPLDLRLHRVLDREFEKLVAGMDDDAGHRYEEAKEYYKTWKTKNRREAAFRSSSSQRIAWQTVRLLTPLFPPPVRAAVSLARTAVQVFRVLSVALDAASDSSSSGSSPQKNRQPEIEKIL